MNLSLLKHSLIFITMMIFFIGTSQPIFASIPIQKKLAELEASSEGRIGVSAINTANHQSIQYRATERFPVCSTNKMIGVAAILKHSMQDTHFLQQKITYKKEDLVVYSPVTEKHIANGMTISELCAATITQSDNSAINFLMQKIGGPKAVTAFARSIGDKMFRLDRWEPELNSAIPGDLRDTSTPAAMEQSLRRLAFGNVLATPQRQQLQTWLKDNTTGNTRIRAGVPTNWAVGDKTGTGDYGTTNDVGIIWPSNCPPIVVAIYFTQNKKDAAPRNDIIASVTRALIREFAKTDPCLIISDQFKTEKTT